MANALSRRMSDVSGTREVEELTGILLSLGLCTTFVEGETTEFEAVELADLLR